MSIIISTDIYCDICGINWIHGGIGPKAEVAHARRLAKRNGWKKYRSPYADEISDVCPHCVEKHGVELSQKLRASLDRYRD